MFGNTLKFLYDGNIVLDSVFQYLTVGDFLSCVQMKNECFEYIRDALHVNISTCSRTMSYSCDRRECRDDAELPGATKNLSVPNGISNVYSAAQSSGKWSNVDNEKTKQAAVIMFASKLSKRVNFTQWTVEDFSLSNLTLNQVSALLDVDIYFF